LKRIIWITTITQTEWDDLNHAVAKYKRKVEEFDFDERESRAVSKGIYPLLGALTITLSDTGEAKTYKTGHGSAWLVEFDDDLKVGLFRP
jgi:hypothetical protein